MFTVHPKRDRGQTTIEFAALVGFAAAIMGVLLTSNVPAQVGNDFGTAVCRILQQDGCGEDVPTAMQPVADRRPAARPDDDPANAQDSGCEVPGSVPGEEVAEPACDWADGVLEYNHEGLIEAEQYGSGYRLHIQRQTTELLTGIVYDVCSNMAGGDREATGKCILALIRNIEIDLDLPVGNGVASYALSEQLEHLTKDKRADDIMDAIEEVRDGEADCLTVSRTWGWGGQTNWGTGDYGGNHCSGGTDPLGGQDTGDTDQLVDAIDDVDDLDQVINDPEAFVDEQIEAMGLDPDDVPAQRQAALDAIGNVTRGLGERVDLNDFLEDLEDALD